MTMVNWILPDGRRITADIADGVNLMNAAVANNVPGIVGECGGCLSCATCHVFVGSEWQAAVAAADGIEDAMLEITETPRTDASRLSCQIIVTAALDGIVLRVPQ
jgi:ferredoxin, 2Fe-2S